MSKEDPKIGDVWVMNGTPNSEGLIIGVQGISFRILGRSRQEISISVTSLKSTWRFLYSLIERSCSVCQEVGWLTDWLDAKPYCERHAPKHQPIWFHSGPTEIDKPHPFLVEIFETCPLCSVPSSVRGREWSPENGWIVGTCRRCRTKTIPLFVSTSTGDSGTFSVGCLIEDTKKAVEHLRNQGYPNIRLVLGAYNRGTHTDQLVKGLKDVAIDATAKIGSNNILVVGTPELSREEAAVLYQHKELGSFWRKLGDTSDRVFQITRLSSVSNREQALFRDVQSQNFEALIDVGIVTCTYTRISNTFTKTPAIPKVAPPKIGDRCFNTELECVTKVTNVSEGVVEFSATGSSHTSTIEGYQLEHDLGQKEFLEWVVGEEYENPNVSGVLTGITDYTVSIEDSTEKQVTTISIKSFFGAKRVVRKTVLERLFDSPFDD